MVLEKIEIHAETLLKKLAISALPIPVDEVAARMRIQIRKAPSKDFSGMLIRKDGYSFIGISSDEVETRQRFTIAHELGHFLLHPKKDTFVDYRDNKSGATDIPREREANMFAAALLMPRKFLEKDYKKYGALGFGEQELTELADKYFVSIDAMRFRLINLNLR